MSVPSIEIIRPNFTKIYVRSIAYWFSYSTCVGFELINGRRVVRENVWGPTTGRHLNAIDGGHKPSRVTLEEFQQLIA